MTPCENNNHIFCTLECECACHEEVRNAEG